MNKLSQNVPKDTYWPFFFALAVTTIAWGLITSWIVSVVGAIVLVISVIGWIGDISL